MTLIEALDHPLMEEAKEQKRRKFLVISYHNGSINIDTIKDTYEEAKSWMDNDVREFIEPMDPEDVDESECWIASRSAFANINGSPCDWVIESIEV